MNPIGSTLELALLKLKCVCLKEMIYLHSSVKHAQGGLQKRNANKMTNVVCACILASLIMSFSLSEVTDQALLVTQAKLLPVQSSAHHYTTGPSWPPEHVVWDGNAHPHTYQYV